MHYIQDVSQIRRENVYRVCQKGGAIYLKFAPMVFLRIPVGSHDHPVVEFPTGEGLLTSLTIRDAVVLDEHLVDGIKIMVKLIILIRIFSNIFKSS